MIEILRTGSAPSASMPDDRMAALVVGRPAAVLGLNITCRSVPRTIFSSASVKSASVTRSWFRFAASSAASLTRLARSAPTIPGVEEAILSRLTSGASGTDFVCTSRISAGRFGPAGCTATRRSKRPGRRRAASRTSGRLVAPITITFVEESNPSISVRIWLSVCSRSSFPPLKPRLRTCGAADGVELVDEDDRRRRFLRLLEEIAHARSADADDRLHELGGASEKNGASASPATARARSVFPFPAGRRAGPRAGSARRASRTCPGGAGSRPPRRAPAWPRRSPRRRRRSRGRLRAGTGAPRPGRRRRARSARRPPGA